MKQYSWISNNPGLVTVDQDGNCQIVGYSGVATITVGLQGSALTKSEDVVVNAPVYLKLLSIGIPSTLEVFAGVPYEVSFVNEFANGWSPILCSDNRVFIESHSETQVSITGGQKILSTQFVRILTDEPGEFDILLYCNSSELTKSVHIVSTVPNVVITGGSASYEIGDCFTLTANIE